MRAKTVGKIVPRQKFEKLQARQREHRHPVPSATTTTAAMALVQTNPDAYVIKPEAVAPAIDTSSWPLLLKNYSDRMQQELS
jgi:hypothetical protein